MFSSASCVAVKLYTTLLTKNFQTIIPMHIVIDANMALATGEVLHIWYNHISKHHHIYWGALCHVM